MEKLNQHVSDDGLVTREYFSHDGELIVDYRQDVEPIFERIKQVRADPSYWNRQVKREMVHALHIPQATIIELLDYGCNPYDAPLKDIVRALKALGKYELCDMTGKRIA